MHDLAGSGGGNVTLPHKGTAAAALDHGLPAVEATGACNCFWLDEGGCLVGDNTDVEGFLAACAEFDGAALDGAEVLLLGAGGAARAVAVACAKAGVASLDIRNRTRRRAEQLVEELGLEGWARVQAASERLGRAYDVVVNATRLGMEPGDPLPVELEREWCLAAIDLVYGHGGTPWTRRAAELGIPAQDGRFMLVHQAARSSLHAGGRAGRVTARNGNRKAR
jgi:shikimate dehydrogenase